MQTLPIHLDLFAIVIFLGVAQSLFLGIFFLVGERGKHVANRCLGWFMLGLGAVTGEIFLCYSNYMFQMLELVDFSEPINFTLGPLFFLFVFARLYQRLPRRWGWHLLPAGLWTLNSISWLYQPIEVKYNNYLEAFHPELPHIAERLYYLPEDFTGGMREYVSELTLLSSLAYNLAALIIIRRAYRRSGNGFWQPEPVRLAQLRNLTLLFTMLPILIAIIKPQFEEDLGDHLLASYLAVVIYAISLLIMSGSPFSMSTPETQAVAADALTEPRKKYEKSAISEEVEEAVLQRLTRLMTEEQPYLQPDLSLPKLAQQVSTSPHTLSQLLNDRLGQTFFDWLAAHRIAEAQRLLNNPATAHLKIDEIAERVGYNSPSAFHTAFKRITQQTPAQFRAKGIGEGA